MICLILLIIFPTKTYIMRCYFIIFCSENNRKSMIDIYG